MTGPRPPAPQTGVPPTAVLDRLFDSIRAGVYLGYLNDQDGSAGVTEGASVTDGVCVTEGAGEADGAADGAGVTDGAAVGASASRMYSTYTAPEKGAPPS